MVQAQIPEQYHFMKWYRNNVVKGLKRTKFGFQTPLLPYLENELNNFMLNELDIFIDERIIDNDNSFHSGSIQYNMFDEDYLIENSKLFLNKISYNIVKNEIVYQNDDMIPIYDVDENNIINYINQLISCLQYDRRLYSTISGKI